MSALRRTCSAPCADWPPRALQFCFQPQTLKRSWPFPTASPFSATASWSPSSTEAKQRKRLSSRHLPKVTDTKESSRHDGGHLFHIRGQAVERLHSPHADEAQNLHRPFCRDHLLRDLRAE